MASSLFLLLPISLVFVIVIGIFFWWAIFSGQFDDTQSGGNSILNDDDAAIEDPEVTLNRKASKKVSPQKNDSQSER
jgi:cbb3-type cytochrome oxidase maturation protein